MLKKSNTSALILASGLSRRMQTSKAELPFDANQIFFQKITNEYLQFGCKEVVVVMNSKNYRTLKEKIHISDKIKILINKSPEKGKFHSLKIGIAELEKAPLIFLQNIDNPFTDINLLNILYNNFDKADYIIPSFKGKGGHPVLISEKVINSVKNSEDRDIHLKKFLNQFNKIYLQTDNEKISVNINTISDYHFYF
jgi:molybdenum cofactor cytidylyltransferase